MQRNVGLRFGQTGSGKTFSANQKFKTCPRAIVAECAFGEFSAIAFTEFVDLVKYLDRIGAFTNKETPFRVSYTPRYGEESLLFELAKELGNCWLYLEEGDRFGEPEDLPAYGELVIRGRHWGVSLEWIGLHPFDCPKDLRRQATEIVSYRQTEPSDIEWLAKKVGELAYQLPELPGPPGSPPFPCLVWDSMGGARIVPAGGAVK